MSSRIRSSSVGSKPRPKLHRPSRAESAAALALDVRCACQFYETKSLLPERVNPVGYNTAEEFEPCVHVQAKLKAQEEMKQNNIAFPVPIALPMTSANRSIMKAANPKTIELPPEFAPIQNENPLQKSSQVLDRSVSCNNMGMISNQQKQQSQQFLKQRDPSTSSLLRKRMSEERGLSSFDKRMSQSTASHDKFLAQKDPSQSTILRRKSYNRSTASFDHARASNERFSCERTQPLTLQQTRIANERTFYHDSNDFTRNSNIEIASPLSMQSHGNRRFMLSSTENLPTQKSSEVIAATKMQIDNDENAIDSNVIEVEAVNAIKKPKSLVVETANNQHLRNQNVSDEEKVQALLSKTTQNASDDKENVDKKDGNVEGFSILSNMVPKLAFLQLMNVEEVQAVDSHLQAKPQVQYIAKMDNTLHPMEAETTEYSFSKIFDSYKSTNPQQQQQMTGATNISTPDLHLNYIKQRDPSRSPFTQNRYSKTVHSTEHKPSEERLLPPAGNFPERRASEQSNQSQFIRQKDATMSNVLNRRRRNLSQISLGQNNEMIDMNETSLKMVKTLSFEKISSHTDLEPQIFEPTTFGASGVRIVKGVSFEYDKMIADIDRNISDFSKQYAETSRRYR